MTTPPKLTAKQEAFCRAIITEPDQSAAYRSVYSTKNCTAKTVNEAASRLMANCKVVARVAALQQAISAAALMEKQEWLERVTKIARADVRKMFDQHGNPVEIPDLDSNEAAAVAGFEFYEEFEGTEGERKAVGVTKKYKLVDRIRALELVGKAYRYLGDDNPKLPQVNHLTLNQTNITITADEAYHRMVQGQ